MNNKNNFSDELKQALKGSWVEHIFFSNLYIVGFGLDKSEIDIWWLLAYRASLIAQNLIEKNIFSESDIYTMAFKNNIEYLNLEDREIDILNRNKMC